MPERACLVVRAAASLIVRSLWMISGDKTPLISDIRRSSVVEKFFIAAVVMVDKGFAQGIPDRYFRSVCTQEKRFIIAC
jgi:hypothetical protein